MKKIIGAFIICAATLFVAAQKNWNAARWQQIIEQKGTENYRMSSQLYQLAKLSGIDRNEAYERLPKAGMRLKADNRINVEIVYRNDENLERITDKVSEIYLQSLGFEVEQVWKNRASVWIKLEDVLVKASRLPSDYFMFLVTPSRNDDQGPGVINSSTYKASPAPAGSGKRVAVFDNGFFNLSGAITNGKAKTPAYVGNGGVASTVAGVNYSGNEHGTACVETVYDHCPNATFEIYANSNTTEKGAAVDDCIAHGVDVISMSQSEYNLGWFDNTGAACAYAQEAANAGILFLTSCGNRANSHYEGIFTDSDADGRHEFSGNDESNNIISSIAPDDGTHCYLSWNTNAGTNFDLYLCRTSDNAILASSTNGGTSVSGFEVVSWSNTGSSSVGVYFRVVRISGPATTFEMFTHSAGDYQFAVEQGSNTSPSNTTDLNVISVGAVSHTDWDEASGTTGIIVGYSSQGPTNSGNIAPKLCGPTATNTWIYGGAFTGTSCSTPNLAGAIIAFWSANSALDATGVRQIMYRKAQLYKDWGVAGNDNVYGYGGLYLYSWASSLKYMLRTGTNAAITNTTRPYYSMAVAQNLAPSGANIIILNGGNYVETGLYGNTATTGLNKSILYRSPFNNVTANFGF